jgi:membrane protease YdiL (CAAX protease family)
LLRRTTDGWAIAGSAALFAAAHLTDPGAGFVLPALFGLGLVLGYLAVKDRGLSRPILVHGGFNLLATVLSLSHR